MRNPKWHRDEIILALDLYFNPERGSIDSRNTKIIELSKLLNTLAIFKFKPDQEKFRNPNGVTLKLSNFKAIDPGYSGKGMEAYSRLDKEVFQEFYKDRERLKTIAATIKEVSLDFVLSKQISEIEDDDESILDSVVEGQVIYKLHKVRERDRRIIEVKKRRVLKETGSLACEACGFDFKKRYGALGDGFIECHHKVPLALVGRAKITKLEDLALVCSNCHRMLHKDLKIRVEDFKLQLNKQLTK